MSERLTDIQRRVAASRERLQGWMRRLAALRAGAGAGGGADAVPTPSPASPLFAEAGAGALEDGELRFEALDTDEPGRER
jgi:hypothetical protein